MEGDMATEQQQNTARLREAWEKWSATKGLDPAMWHDYVTDDLKLFSLADGDHYMPFTSYRTGRAALDDYLEGLISTFSMDLWQIDDTVAEGDRVVGIGSCGFTHKETGKSFVTPVVIVTQWRDGRICEYSEYYDTAKIAASAV
jgi:uncharacterized protein